MVLIKRSYSNRNCVIEVTQDILDQSFPNRDYFSIASHTFEHVKLGIKKSNLEYFYNFFSMNSLGYFLIAHGSRLGDKNSFEFYETQFLQKNLESHLLERKKELNFDFASILVCNEKNILNINTNILNFPIAIPKDKFKPIQYNHFLFFNV